LLFLHENFRIAFFQHWKRPFIRAALADRHVYYPVSELL
jgi:hypothetical protein